MREGGRPRKAWVPRLCMESHERGMARGVISVRQAWAWRERETHTHTGRRDINTIVSWAPLWVKEREERRAGKESALSLSHTHTLCLHPSLYLSSLPYPQRC